MIKNIKASNFRSLKDANIDFAPLTFVYGNNAAGKSSIFYAFNVLRNILVNPNQPTDSFFDLGFANLGSFNDVVFRHDVNNPISISVSAKIDKVSFDYGISIKGTKGTFTLNVGKPYGLALELPVAFPYAINANTQSEVVLEEIHYKISWN
ncbi:MAG: AAA family ATPase, partial [Candidatus Taylorbacteria bacterium]|nr:AAA family ATPase [Candidatus Taylorbacteria bacterium]